MPKESEKLDSLKAEAEKAAMEAEHRILDNQPKLSQEVVLECRKALEAGIDWKIVVRQVLESVIFPEIDKKVSTWHTPFEIDDKVWAFLKLEILKALAAARQDALECK